MNKISILLPSRGRVSETKMSLESLYSLCDDICNFEICVRIDEDDLESLSLFDEFKLRYDNIKLTIGPRLGYHKLNILYDETLELSSEEADYIYVWGNDNIMLSDKWDVMIKNCTQNNPAVVWPNKNKNELYYCFPIIHKRWFKDFENKFPNNSFVDSFFFFMMLYVIEGIGARQQAELEGISGIKISHLLLKDDVHNEAEKTKSPRPSSAELKSMAKESAKKLLEKW